MRKKRNAVILTGFILISIITNNLFVYSNKEIGTFEELGVDAKDELYDNLAYKNDAPEKGEFEDDENPKFRALVKEIKTMGLGLIDKENFLSSIYTDVYVNPSNNTVFIMTTGEPQEVYSKLVEAISPDEGLNMIVKKVKYTRGELESAIDKILALGMIPESGKYQMSSIFISTEGTVVVELVDITPENALSFIDSIPKSIPTDMLMLRRGSKVEACSLTEKHRPVIGGIKFKARYSLEWTRPGSIGFIGKDEDNDWGYLTAAHVTETGFWDGNHQPTDPNLIGQTKVEEHDAVADAGWVEFESGITYEKELHPQYSNTEFIVKYRDDLFDLSVGENVRYMGFESGFVYTEINAFTSCTYKGITVYNTIRMDDPCQEGDSGGPIYSRSYAGNQVYHVTAKGILVAKNANYAYGCAIDFCEAAMDLNIDITD